MKESVIIDDPADDLPQTSNIEIHRVDRSMIKNYLHQIRDEVDDVFIYNFVGTRVNVLHLTKIKYNLCARHFAGFPVDTIKKTFLATTQYARKGAFPGMFMKHLIKSPNQRYTYRAVMKQ